MTHNILDKDIKIAEVVNGGLHSLPFVISIPHSGTFITSEMNKILRNDTVLSNMDWYLPELYNFLADLGYSVVINKISRYVIDVNRDVDSFTSSEYNKSLIYTKTTFGREMYSEELSRDVINDRIRLFYSEYHRALMGMISKKLEHFSKVYVIDLHSFGKQLGADIVLGNGNGRTMSEKTFECIAGSFIDNGFKVALNAPFSGGFITKHYGTAGSPIEAVQIELSYDSYIDNRVFGEEELPHINEEIMEGCRSKLQRIFSELRTMNRSI